MCRLGDLKTTKFLEGLFAQTAHQMLIRQSHSERHRDRLNNCLQQQKKSGEFWLGSLFEQEDFASSICGFCRFGVEALATEAEASAALQAEGLIVMSGNVVKQHPAVRIGREARATAIRLLIELGCSPLSRTRLDMRPPRLSDIENPFEKIKRLQFG